jgi:hypothetical protein
MAAQISASATVARNVFSLAKSSDIRWAIGGWAFFIAENAILSENRTWLIDDVFNGDDQMYHIAYGICSTVATSSIGYSYIKLSRLIPSGKLLLPQLSMGWIAASWCSASLGLVMLSQTLPRIQLPVEMVSNSIAPDVDEYSLTSSDSKGWKFQVRCPFDFSDKKHVSGENDNGVNLVGVERITRHPGLWSLAFLGTGSAIWQPTLALSVWMMGPTAVAFFGGNHNDSRFRRGIGGTMDPSYASLTSNVPFAAILSGKQGNVTNVSKSLVIDETKLLNAAAATAVASVWIISKGRSRRLAL